MPSRACRMARPPPRRSRFMPPQPREALDRRARCVRAGPALAAAAGLVPRLRASRSRAMDRDEAMGEDCLMLNVWTPGVGAGGKRPVMVWLHGGGFASGSGGFDLLRRRQPRAQARRGRRVGQPPAERVRLPLSRRVSAASSYADASNVGMLDIVAALEWVRDNIAALRRRSGQRHDLRPVRRRRQGEHADGDAVGEGPVPPRHRRRAARPCKGVPKRRGEQTAEAFLAKLNLKPNQVDELQKLRWNSCSSARRRRRRPGARGVDPVVDGTHAADRSVRSDGARAVREHSAAHRHDGNRSHLFFPGHGARPDRRGGAAHPREADVRNATTSRWTSSSRLIAPDGRRRIATPICS